MGESGLMTLDLHAIEAAERLASKSIAPTAENIAQELKREGFDAPEDEHLDAARAVADLFAERGGDDR